jgi:protein-tyrosine phosphatase
MSTRLVTQVIKPLGWSRAGSGAVSALGGACCLGATLAIHGGFNRLTKGKEMLTLELSALQRFGSNFDQITQNPKESGNLFVGGMPNRLNGDLARMQQANIEVVISVNEDWELEARGPSIPYTAEEYARAGIAFHNFPSKDHELPADDNLAAIASIIKSAIDNKKNALIHCRAGKGRSAIGALWYLMMFKGLSAKDAVEMISSARAITTLTSKKGKAAQQRCEEYLKKPGVLATSQSPSHL